MSEDSLERCFTANSNIVIQHNHQDLDFDQFRPVSPNFKGFTKLNRIYSKNIRRKCVQSWRKPFRGFTSNDYKQTNGAWRRSKELLCHISGPVTSSSFLGFNIEESKNAIGRQSALSSICHKLECDLYKQINRKLLREYSSDEKVVRSKYWAPNWPKTKLEIEFPVECKIKVEDSSKADAIDREHAIISQIQQLNKELSELRKVKQAASEQAKLQTSPFFQVKEEFHLPKFVPPKSPHHLLEEDLYVDPWSVLISAIFLNKTTARTARPYVFWFLEDNPDPFTVLTKNVEDLEGYFGYLGLQKTRAKQVWKMSYDFLHKDWTKVGELYGVGKYAEDAFRMFCLGDFSVEPEDRYLRIYKAWYVNREKQGRLAEMNN